MIIAYFNRVERFGDCLTEIGCFYSDKALPLHRIETDYEFHEIEWKKVIEYENKKLEEEKRRYLVQDDNWVVPYEITWDQDRNDEFHRILNAHLVECFSRVPGLFIYRIIDPREYVVLGDVYEEEGDIYNRIKIYDIFHRDRKGAIDSIVSSDQIVIRDTKLCLDDYSDDEEIVDDDKSDLERIYEKYNNKIGFYFEDWFNDEDNDDIIIFLFTKNIYNKNRFIPLKKEPSKEFGYIYIDDKNDGGFYYFEKEKDASLIYKKKGIESEITDRNYYIEGEGNEQIIFIGDEEAWNPKDDFSVISGRKLFNSKGFDEN